MYGKYSVMNMAKVFREKKHLIFAEIKGQSVEGYGDNASGFLGMSAVMFMFVFILGLALWVWAWVAIFQNKDQLSQMVLILAILANLGILGGPVIALFLVYVFRGKQQDRLFFHAKRF